MPQKCHERTYVRNVLTDGLHTFQRHLLIRIAQEKSKGCAS